VKSNMTAFFGRMLAHQIRLGTLDEYIRFLRSKGNSSATINKEMSVLRMVFKFAVEHEHLPENPMKKSFHQRVINKKLDYFSEIEVRSLLDQNKSSEIYPILFIAIHTGMRLSEILGLCWDRVDFVSNRIEITRTLVRSQLQETTKTGKARYFPMNAKLRDMFFQLRQSQAQSNLVFTDLNGNGYNSDHFRQRYFSKVCIRARVRQLRFHDLRHTFASHFMMKGGDLFELSKLLGHSDVKMTQVYAHLSPQHLERASEIVDFGIGFSEDISFLSPENFANQNLRLISGS